MFQLPPQIVLGCSNSKWYLNLVFHPLNTSCKNQEPTRHDHNVTAFYTKLYWFHHGRSLPRTFSPLTFSITEPSQLHSSSAIGFRHYAPLTLIPLGGGLYGPPLDVSRDYSAMQDALAATFHDFFLSSIAQLLRTNLSLPRIPF